MERLKSFGNTFQRNLICKQCNGNFQCCFDLQCKETRIFCGNCLVVEKLLEGNQSSTDRRFLEFESQSWREFAHTDHTQNVFCLAELAESKGSSHGESLKIETTFFQEQYAEGDKQTSEFNKLMCEIDELELYFKNQIKSLKSNINEVFYGAGASKNKQLSIPLADIDTFLSEFNQDFMKTFEDKVDHFLNERRSNLDNLNISFDCNNQMKSIQRDISVALQRIINTIKITRNFQAKQIIPTSLGENITEMSLTKNNLVAICGKSATIIQAPFQEFGQKSSEVWNLKFASNVDYRIRSVRFSPDSTLFGVAGGSKLILYSCDGMQKLADLNLSFSSINFQTLDISPNNLFLAAATKGSKRKDNSVGIYSIDKDNESEDKIKLRQLLVESDSLILSVRFSADSQLLLTAGCDYAIYVYHFDQTTQKFKIIQKLYENNDIINGISISFDCRVMVSVSSDGKCFLYQRKGKGIQAQEFSKEQQMIENQIQNEIELSKTIQLLNSQFSNRGVSSNSSENQPSVENSQLVSQIQKIFTHIHSNPYLAQSILETQNENMNQNEPKVVPPISVLEPSQIDEEKQDNNDIDSSISMFTKVSCISTINQLKCVDIHSSGKLLALGSADEIKVYDISTLASPFLINSFKNIKIDHITQLQFSHKDPTIIFSDTKGDISRIQYM